MYIYMYIYVCMYIGESYPLNKFQLIRCVQIQNLMLETSSICLFFPFLIYLLLERFYDKNLTFKSSSM